MKYVHVGYEIRVSSSLHERPPQVDEVAVVLATPEPPPERPGVTHWSSRLLATRSWRRRSAPIHPQFASTREGRQGAFAYRTYPVNDPRARGSSANAPHDHYGQCCHSSSFFRAQRTGSGPFSARCSKRYRRMHGYRKFPIQAHRECQDDPRSGLANPLHLRRNIVQSWSGYLGTRISSAVPHSGKFWQMGKAVQDQEPD